MATRFAADRFVYVFAPDKRLTSGVGITLDVYADEALTVLAGITELDGTPIPGSRIVVAADSLLPEFLDPSNRVTLYVAPPGATEGSAINPVLPDTVTALLAPQVAAEVADYIASNPIEAAPSADQGNLLTVGTDGRIMLDDAALPDPVLNHGGLTGLDADDHPQYLNQARGDARYPLATAVTTALAGKVGTADSRLSDARNPLPHAHAVADVSGLQAVLDGKVASSDPRLTDARTPTAHSHPIGQVTSLQAALDAKVGTTDPRLSDARTPTAHVHAQADVTGLATALAGKAPTAHSHAIADTTGLQAALDAKSATGHTHDDRYFTEAEADGRFVRSVSGVTPDGTGNVTLPATVTDHGNLTGLADDDHPQYLTQARGDARYPLATAVTTALAGKVDTGDARLSDARTPTAHSHTIADTTGLQAALDTKVASTDPRLSDARTPMTHSHTQADVTGLAAALGAKSEVGHTHVFADTPGLQEALEGKQVAGDYATNPAVNAALDGKADTDHTHTFAEIPGLAAALDEKQVAGDYQPVGDYVTTPGLTAGLATKADTVHTHGIPDVTGLTDSLAGKAATVHTHALTEVSGLQGALDAKAASVHSHAVADTTGLQAALDTKLNRSAGVSMLGYAAAMTDIPPGSPIGSVWVIAPGAFNYGPTPVIAGVQVTATSASGADLVALTPPDSQAGDLLLVYLASSETAVTANWTVPTGWVRQSTAPAAETSGNNNSLRNVAVMTRVLTAPGAASYTFTSPGTSGSRREALVILIRGADPTAPVGGVTAWQGVTGSGTVDLTIPAQNSTRPSNLQVVFASTNGTLSDSIVAATPSPALTQRAHQAEPTSGSVSKTTVTGWTRPLDLAGNSGSITLDFPQTAQRAAIALLIQPVVI